MAQLRLSLLGSPQAWHGQQPLTFTTRKVSALLIYLAVGVGVHRREKLVQLPGDPGAWPANPGPRP